MSIQNFEYIFAFLTNLATCMLKKLFYIIVCTNLSLVYGQGKGNYAHKLLSSQEILYVYPLQKLLLQLRAIKSLKSTSHKSESLSSTSSVRFPRQGAELTPGGIGGGVSPEEQEVMSMSEEGFAHSYANLRADTSWLKGYYKLLDTPTVNPYQRKWRSFADTLNIVLFDSLKALGWAPPVSNKMYVTSDFGMRRYKWHYGVDLRLKYGDSVQNVFYGVVRLSKYQRRGFGNYVVIHHYNGLETIYAHLAKRLVQEGDIIQAGEVIGLGGSTGRSSGPHLHFEVRYEGLPLDPNELFAFENGVLQTKFYNITSAKFNYLQQATSILVHRVRRGETLSHLAQRYGVSISYLTRINGISRRSIIRIGQRIRIR